MTMLSRVVGGMAVLLVLAAPVAGETPGAPGSDDAERLLERIIAEQRAGQARDRAEADRLVNAALQFLKKGDYTAAKETVERALRLDAGNKAGQSLLAQVTTKLAPPKAEPITRVASPRQIEEQLRVALLEGRRLVADGQPMAAIEVLENAERAIAMVPGAVNLAPYRAETTIALAAARAAFKPGPEPDPDFVNPESKPRGPIVPNVFNPSGTPRRGEAVPSPRPTVSETERRMIRRDVARYWAKPSTYHEEYDYATAELAVRPIGPTPLIRYPADWNEKTARRVPRATGDPEWRLQLKARLAEPLDSKVDFKGVTLTQALAFLRDLTGVNMVVDSAAAKAAGNRKITFQVGRVSLGSALNLVAEMTGTEHVLRNEVVLFTTPDRAKTFKVARLYNISFLTMPHTNHLEWRPLRPPGRFDVDPWWGRYLDYWDRWGGFGNGGGYPGQGRESHYPPFWPSKYMEGDSRERRTEALYDMIDRVLGRPEKE